MTLLPGISKDRCDKEGLRGIERKKNGFFFFRSWWNQYGTAPCGLIRSGHAGWALKCLPLECTCRRYNAGLTVRTESLGSRSRVCEYCTCNICPSVLWVRKKLHLKLYKLSTFVEVRPRFDCSDLLFTEQNTLLKHPKKAQQIHIIYANWRRTSRNRPVPTLHILCRCEVWPFGSCYISRKNGSFGNTN